MPEPQRQDAVATLAGGGAGAMLLTTVRWELIPQGEVVKILVAFLLLGAGYLMYREKQP